MSAEIVAMLDLLAEFHSQKDSIDAQKRALMDEVKVPAEVEAIVKAGMTQVASVERGYYAKFDELNREVTAQLEKIAIPEEIKLALAAIDRERALVQAYKAAKETEYRAAIAAKKQELQEMYEAQTRDVYAALERRKHDIEAEFAGRLDAVDENIKALEAEIKTNTKAEGRTVKGKYFSAIYVTGRTSWDTKGLNEYADQHPGVVKYRTVGEPSITLRKV